MSDKQRNISVEGEVDAGWNSYWGEGKTVDVHNADGDPDTDESATEVWPDIEADPEDLASTQQEVIRKAALHRPQSLRDLADLATVTPQTVSKTLRDYWPDGYDAVRSRPTNTVSEDVVDDVRRRLLDGESRKDVANDLGVSVSRISQYATGRVLSDKMELSVPPVTYDRDAGGYVPVDDSDDGTQNGDDGPALSELDTDAPADSPGRVDDDGGDEDATTTVATVTLEGDTTLSEAQTIQAALETAGYGTSVDLEASEVAVMREGER